MPVELALLRPGRISFTICGKAESGGSNGRARRNQPLGVRRSYVRPTTVTRLGGHYVISLIKRPTPANAGHLGEGRSGGVASSSAIAMNKRLMLWGALVVSALLATTGGAWIL